jgi:uncharacterized low-complexity protein
MFASTRNILQSNTYTREIIMKKTLGVTIGSALLISLSGTAAQAGENPFAMQELSSGYQLTQAGATTLAKNNEGKCGASAKGKDGKCGSGKCGQGKCGGKK